MASEDGIAGQGEAAEETEKVDEGPVKDADGWEDMMDGKVRKRTVKVGKGDAVDLQRDVLCSFDVRLSLDGEILQRRKNIRYRIGESEAIPGLELALRHMFLGEEADVFCISRFAWGPAGCKAAEAQEKDVPEDTDVYLNVKLIDMYPASPEDDSQKNWAHRVQELEWRRTNGNDHYRRRNMQLAARCYEKGMEVFPETPVQAPTSVGLSGKAAAAAVTKTIADVASNLSAVYLEQGRARDASDHAKIAVDLVPKHAKAIFRLAKASFLLGDFEECQARINELQGLQPEEDAAVKRLVADLERARTKHASKSKKLGAALLEAAGEGREYVEKPPPEEPPTFLQELLEPMIPSKKQVILLGALVMLSALVIFFAPQRHRPQVVIISLLASTLIFAIYTAVTQADADIAEAKKK
ncbi:unnamed protein product [Cladocopium goreaui]|uniref:peptidylprolyl isomerase n=1 Tax=Cladocopium goreaui TaxID=2562237 RepID=A0A9P1FKB3_9DINO|nr:unnamed protein product [Cladocopium goreaui]